MDASGARFFDMNGNGSIEDGAGDDTIAVAQNELMYAIGVDKSDEF